MKKLILIVCVFIMSITHAQNYNKWSIEAETGISKLHGYTYVVPYNVELSTRYMFNNKFGLKLQGGYTEIKEYKFYNVGFHTVVNLGRVLEFESFTKHYTILAGVGVTYTNSNSTILQDRLSMGHLSVFIDNLIKLTDNTSLKIGMDFIGDINNRHFDASSRPSTFSRLQNYNIGFVFNLGKQKEHADWYYSKENIVRTDTIFMKPTIIDKTVTVTEYDCNCDINSDEYVFFGHDKYEVTKDALHSIMKIASILLEQENKTVLISGFASPPASNEYNLQLSLKRCNTVKNKLLSLGIDENRIEMNPVGEIETVNGKNEDLTRKVYLQIK